MQLSTPTTKLLPWVLLGCGVRKQRSFTVQANWWVRKTPIKTKPSQSKNRRGVQSKGTRIVELPAPNFIMSQTPPTPPTAVAQQ